MASRLDVDCRDLAAGLTQALEQHVGGGVEALVREGCLELVLREVRLPPAGPLPLPPLPEVRIRLLTLPAPSPHQVAIAWEWSAKRVPAWLSARMKELVSSFLEQRLARIPAIAQAFVSMNATVLVLDPREIRIGTVRLGDVLEIEEVAIPGRERAGVTIAGSRAAR